MCCHGTICTLKGGGGGGEGRVLQCVLCSLQRDRGLIKDLLMEVDRYCTRNLKEREEKAELERRRQHEAQHAQLVAAQKSLEETQQFTAGGSLGGQVGLCACVHACVQCR